MNPFVLLLLAILTPFVLIASLFGPSYGSIALACHIIYDTSATTQPLAGKFLDPFYILDVYGKLFSYWRAHMGSADFVHYTLPVAILPLAGVLFSLWLTRRIARKMMDVFHLFGGH